MKLIDRYILFKFLRTVLFVVLILNAIICVIDYGEKSDDFIQHPDLSTYSILVDYYFNFFLNITNLLSPVTVFIATVFMTAQLASRTEIVAILSNGTSFRRIMMPYMMGAILLAILTFGMTGWIIPKANKTRVAFEVEYLKKQYYFDQRNVHIKVAPNTFVYLQNYNNITNTGYLFTIEKIIDGNLVEKLSAPRIEWDSAKTKWHIESYKRHIFRGEIERLESGRNMDTTLHMRPKDFESKHLLHETLTLPELDDYITLQLARGNTKIGIFEVEKYERYTYPFTIIILTAMGVILSARKSRQGIGMQIAFGFLLAFMFITFVRMTRSMGQAGTLDPQIAAWLPRIVFTFITGILYKTVPR